MNNPKFGFCQACHEFKVIFQSSIDRWRCTNCLRKEAGAVIVDLVKLELLDEKHLIRSRELELLNLAEDVLAGPTGYPESWANKLAADFSRFND